MSDVNVNLYQQIAECLRRIDSLLESSRRDSATRSGLPQRSQEQRIAEGFQKIVPLHMKAHADSIEALEDRVGKLETEISEGFAQHGAAWASGFEAKLEGIYKRLEKLENPSGPPPEKRRFPSPETLAAQLRNGAWAFAPKFTALVGSCPWKTVAPILSAGPVRFAYLFGVLEAYQRLSAEARDNLDATRDGGQDIRNILLEPIVGIRLESWLILQIRQTLEKLSKEDPNG